jgi:hypothetical protein
MYTAKVGGYNYRRAITSIQADLRQQRGILAKIAQGDLSTAELYQSIAALSLLNAELESKTDALNEYREEGKIEDE